jgi:hypothetical protein
MSRNMREAMQEKQTKRSASDPEFGEGVASPSSATVQNGIYFSLAGCKQ